MFTATPVPSLKADLRSVVGGLVFYAFDADTVKQVAFVGKSDVIATSAGFRRVGVNLNIDYTALPVQYHLSAVVKDYSSLDEFEPEMGSTVLPGVAIGGDSLYEHVQGARIDAGSMLLFLFLFLFYLNNIFFQLKKVFWLILLLMMVHFGCKH